MVMELAGRVTRHAKTQAGVLTTKELVIVGAHLWTSSHASESPSVQLAGKRGELRRFEISWQDMRSEALLLVNDEAPTVGQPGDRISIFFVAQNIEQLRSRFGRGRWTGEASCYQHDDPQREYVI